MKKSAKNLLRIFLLVIILPLLFSNCGELAVEEKFSAITSFSYSTYLKNGKTEAIFTWSAVPGIEYYKLAVIEGTSITPGGAANYKFTTSKDLLKLYDPYIMGGKTYSLIVQAVFKYDDPVYSKPITLTIPAVKSTDARLTGINFTAGTLNPAFNSTIKEYTLTGADIGNSINVTAICPSAASMKLNNLPITSGVQVSNGLSSSDTILNFTITAEDGVSKNNYKFLVHKGSGDNANLSKLTVSAGTLNFDPLVTAYNISFISTIESITFTPTSMDVVSSITVNGETISSGNTSSAINFTLEGEQKIIPIVVTALDTSTKTYTVTAKRGYAFTGYTENFESFSNTSGMEAAGWTIWNIDGDIEKWTISNYDNNNYASVMFNYNGNNDWLITPGIPIGPQNCRLRFKAKSAHALFPEDLEVLIYQGESFSSAASFTKIFQVKPVPSNLTQYTVNLTGYTGKIFIAFRYVSVDKFTLFIDDVIVEPQ